MSIRSARSTRVRTVLLMWEYGCEHSPVWSRSGDLEIGPIDVTDLGVDPALREDLASWNRRIEVAADPNDAYPADQWGPEWWEAQEVEAFALAVRLQRALGSSWTVQCVGGSGDGDLDADGLHRFQVQDGRAQLLLHDGALRLLAPPSAQRSPLEVPAELRDAIHDWVALGNRRARTGSEEPGGVDPGEHRLHGLELAHRLAAEVPNARILWFGGEDLA